MAGDEDAGDEDAGDENEGDAGSFEQRLAAARVKQGMGTPARPAADLSAASSGSAMGIGVRVGVELVSALLVAVAIGWVLDRWLHTTPVFIGIFVLLGGAAGVANVWRLMGRTAAGKSPGSGG